MFDAQYRKRLTEDLPAWRDKGWVTENGSSAILASVQKTKGSGFGFAALVAVLGAILLGIGVIAFVASNWDDMPRFARFLLLIAVMVAAYGIAAWLERRDLSIFSGAATLAASMFFAASIALVGQTYHLSGDFADAVLLWLVGGFAAALLTRSVPVTVLVLGGAAYWTWIATFDNGVVPHWGGLVAILAGGALAVWFDSRIARSAAIVALGVWFAATIFTLGSVQDWRAAASLAVLACTGLCFWAIASLLSTLHDRPRIAVLGRELASPALAGFLLALAFLQSATDWSSHQGNQMWIALAIAALLVGVLVAGVAQQRGNIRLIDVVAVAVLGGAAIGLGLWTEPDDFGGRLAGGIVVLLAALWAISLSHRGHPIENKLGLFVFGAEVLYLYTVTLGTLLDTAITFLVGGVLFIGLALLLYRFNRRLAAAQPEVAQ